MMGARQFVGALTAAFLAPVAVWGQVGSMTAPSSAPTITNSPVASPLPGLQPPLAVEPMQLQIAVPHPAPVDIPPATAPPPASSSAVNSPSRPMPLNIPTTQELLTKSMASAPGGSQDKLNAIVSSALLLSPTNSAAPNGGLVTLSSTNSSTNQTNIWQRNNPLLNGVDYHW